MRAQSGFSPSNLVRASFKQYQAEGAIPASKQRVKELTEEIDGLKIEKEDAIVDFLKIRRKLCALELELRERVCRAKHVLRFMQPGRLVRVLPEEPVSRNGLAVGATQIHGDERTEGGEGAGGSGVQMDDESISSEVRLLKRECPWGVVVNVEKLGSDMKSSGVRYMVDVLAHTIRSSRGRPRIAIGKGTGAEIVSVPLTRVADVSSVRIHLPPDLRPKDARARALDIVGEVCRRYPNGVPCLDTEEDMKLNDADVRKILRRVEAVENALAAHAMAKEDEAVRASGMAEYERKCELVAMRKAAERQVRDAGEVVMRAELRSRQRVLRRLEYVDKEGVVLMKGHIAAEISSGDDLVLTELLMDGTFASLKPEDIAALLSCSIHEEKLDGGSKHANRVRPELEKLNSIIRNTAERVAEVSLDCNLDINRQEYVERFRPEMMEVMYMWATGATFGDVCKMTDAYEGSVVRLIRRVEELLRQLVAAAEIMQEQALRALFEESIERIRRDVVFAPNLYL